MNQGNRLGSLTAGLPKLKKTMNPDVCLGPVRFEFISGHCVLTLWGECQDTFDWDYIIHSKKKFIESRTSVLLFKGNKIRALALNRDQEGRRAQITIISQDN